MVKYYMVVKKWGGHRWIDCLALYSFFFFKLFILHSVCRMGRMHSLIWTRLAVRPPPFDGLTQQPDHDLTFFRHLVGSLSLCVVSYCCLDNRAHCVKCAAPVYAHVIGHGDLVAKHRDHRDPFEMPVCNTVNGRIQNGILVYYVMLTKEWKWKR